VRRAVSAVRGAAVLFHDLSAFEAAFREAKYTVAHDTLTELASRDSLMVQLDVAMAQAAHTGQPLSVCICDIDRFKSVNDTHGHAAGDEILPLSESSSAAASASATSPPPGRR